jgi:hypothetical protein
MTAAPAAGEVTVPGVYQVDADTYHADPVAGGSLSSSGARKLLPPHCPARYRWERDNPPPPRPHFDIGHAAHRLVLGDGPDIVVIDAEDWRTKAAKAARDEAHAAGQVPLLTEAHDQVQAMAAAIRAHPVASRLFTPGRGRPEQALIWRDDATGVMRRALLDWLPDVPGGRLIVPDYKTARSGDPDELSRAAHNYSYHQQAAWYLDGVRALGLGNDDAAFVFVCQEKDPPYLVTIVELDHVAMRIGDLRNRRALNIYAECVRTGRWPGYADDRVELLSLPPWAEAQEGAS